MRIVRHHNHCPEEAKNAVIALGNFDGVHKGHQAVISEAVCIARQENLPSAIITFEPHPRRVLFPDSPNIQLCSFRQKIRQLEQLGIDTIFAVHFTKEFSQLSGEEFIRDILVGNLSARHIVIGHDFIFGHKRSGNASLLAEKSSEYNYKLTQLDAVHISGEIFSSTKIREYLQNGDVPSANNILGHDYAIEGIVRKGESRGRKIGFPTANIAMKNRLLPALGVYTAEVRINGKKTTHHAIVNIGIKPTFGEHTPMLEAHLLNFNDDLYGKRISVKLLNFFRPEQKFNNIDDLKQQIAQDALQAEQYFRERVNAD